MASGTGQCICGAVAFRVDGPLRDVLICHCTECRRWAGHAWAASAAYLDDLSFVEDRGLRWIDSPDSAHDARRGFCGECGSSLFWQEPGRDRISIAAGCLDAPTGITTVAQLYVTSAGDYYELDERLRSFDGEADDVISAMPSED
jgi:hypothetical protein